MLYCIKHIFPAYMITVVCCIYRLVMDNCITIFTIVGLHIFYERGILVTRTISQCSLSICCLSIYLDNCNCKIDWLIEKSLIPYREYFRHVMDAVIVKVHPKDSWFKSSCERLFVMVSINHHSVEDKISICLTKQCGIKKKSWINVLFEKQ